MKNICKGRETSFDPCSTDQRILQLMSVASANVRDLCQTHCAKAEICSTLLAQLATTSCKQSNEVATMP